MMDRKTYETNFNTFLNQLFNEDKWEIRAEAARKLGLLKDGRAINLLLKALKNEKDDVVINRIIEAMGTIGDPRATMLIVDFLKKDLDEEHPNKKRLFAIIDSLMKIGDKRALEQLGILHDNCEADIRERTEAAFDCIDPNWKENIKKS